MSLWKVHIENIEYIEHGRKKKSVIIALITFVKMRKDPILPPSRTGDWIHPIYQSHATYVDNV